MEYTQTGVNRALKDIRPRAEERARRRQEEAQRPPGTGFMSERSRAKEALRVEVNTYTGENVRKIAATAAVAGKIESSALRRTAGSPQTTSISWSPLRCRRTPTGT